MKMSDPAHDSRRSLGLSRCGSGERNPVGESEELVRPRRVFWLVLFGLAGGFLLFRFDPATTGWYPRCMLHSLTGLYCAGCGAQRAIHLLAHGRIVEALRMNALVVAGIPFGLAWWRFRFKSAPWIAIVAVVLFAVLRNVPAWPFSLLVPD